MHRDRDDMSTHNAHSLSSLQALTTSPHATTELPSAMKHLSATAGRGTRCRAGAPRPRRPAARAARDASPCAAKSPGGSPAPARPSHPAPRAQRITFSAGLAAVRGRLWAGGRRCAGGAAADWGHLAHEVGEAGVGDDSRAPRRERLRTKTGQEDASRGARTKTGLERERWAFLRRAQGAQRVAGRGAGPGRGDLGTCSRPPPSLLLPLPMSLLYTP